MENTEKCRISPSRSLKNYIFPLKAKNSNFHYKVHPPSKKSNLSVIIMSLFEVRFL